MTVVHRHGVGSNAIAGRFDGITAAVEAQVCTVGADRILTLAGDIQSTAAAEVEINAAEDRGAIQRIRTAVYHTVDGALRQGDTEPVAADGDDAAAIAAVDIYAVKDKLYLTLMGIDIHAAHKLTRQDIAARLLDQEPAILMTEIHISLRKRVYG